MKIAVLGGSFNPVHIGHLILSDFVCEKLGYDKILFVPAFMPPHKEMSNAASVTDRKKMIEKAIKGDKRFVLEEYELQKKGISYTWDTICFLEQKYKNELTDKIGLIIGFDLACNFHKWKNAKELAQKCELILAVRSSVQNENQFVVNRSLGSFAEEDKNFTVNDFSFPHVKISNPQIDISSSDIRLSVLKNDAFRYLVGNKVFEYIKRKNLYGYKFKDLNKVDIQNPVELEKVILQLDEVLKTKVGANRYEHSVRTAKMAEQLSNLYGLNGRIGYLCGIAHDICKEIPSEEMIDFAKQDGKEILLMENQKPSLLHGRAAAIYIKNEFKILDKNVLEAIANHTYGAKGLCDYGKILFVADKIEPGRPQSTDKYRQNLLNKSLNDITLSVLQENIDYQTANGKKVAEDSFLLRDELLEKTGQNKKVLNEK